MVHAGLLPQWTVRKALALAREAEVALAASTYREFLANMYGSTPDTWSDALEGWDRLRAIVNAMTRMRFCTPEGRMDFRAKGTKAPAGFRSWFELRGGKREKLLCGHWSALGLRVTERLAMLDAGCVWRGALVAMRLEDREIFRLKCGGYQDAKGE
jgi:bis(5'-nucleosyl)-tetraphosphatase (symmetrical)